MVVAVVDGYSLAWLVDGDTENARRGLHGFGAFLVSQSTPRAASTEPSDTSTVDAASTGAGAA